MRRLTFLLLAASSCLHAETAVPSPSAVEPMGFPDRESALSKPSLESPWCLLLDGPWKFQFSANAAELPQGFEKDGFDTAAWKDLAVPSNWELQGYGTLPTTPGACGSYRRAFTLPAGWETRRTRLAFEGVETSFEVWINGQKAGHADGSRPVQFDITPFVKPGENSVAVQVRDADAPSQPDGISWRLGGIFRDVFLSSSPEVGMSVRMVEAAGADKEPDGGSFRGTFAIWNHAAAAFTGKLKIEMLSPEGGSVFVKEMECEIPAGGGGKAVEVNSGPLSGIRMWSSEMPVLYPYVVTLTDANGGQTACYAGKAGFRRDAVEGDKLVHNGRPILIKGVDYRSHHARTGHAVSAADLRADLLQIKRANLNSLRLLSPPDARLLDLCDELGLYVWEPSPRPGDEAHPSLLAAAGVNLESPGDLARPGQPALFVNYNPATGNSSGNLAARWDLIRNVKQAQGGFIGEWKDLTFVQKKTAEPSAGQSSRVTYTYGGDARRVCGLVNSMQVPTPQFEEVRKVLQDIHTTLADGATPVVKVSVRNERFFLPVDDLRASWKLLKDGREVAQGELALPAIAPGASAELPIPTNVQADPAAEFILRIRYDLRQDTAWSPAGMPIAWDELPLPWGKRTVVAPESTTTAAKWTEEGSSLHLSAGDVNATIDRGTGCLVSLKCKDAEILLSPMRPDFWRVPTQNDKIVNFDKTSAVWKEAGPKAVAKSCTVSQAGNDVVVRAELAIPAGSSSAILVWRFTGAGQIAADFEFKPDPSQPPVPRVGLSCRVATGMNDWTWFGKGPHENHEDRNSGAWTTVHNGMVPTLVYRYAIPQESGNRTDVRWSTFGSPGGGGGLRVDAGESLLQVSLLQGDPAQYESAAIVSDLPKPEGNTLHLDLRQMGVARGAKGLAADQVYHESFLVTPLHTNPPARAKTGLPQGPPPGVVPPGLPPGMTPPPGATGPPRRPGPPKPTPAPAPAPAPVPAPATPQPVPGG